MYKVTAAAIGQRDGDNEEDVHYFIASTSGQGEFNGHGRETFERLIASFQVRKTVWQLRVYKCDRRSCRDRSNFQDVDGGQSSVFFVFETEAGRELVCNPNCAEGMAANAIGLMENNPMDFRVFHSLDEAVNYGMEMILLGKEFVGRP